MKKNKKRLLERIINQRVKLMESYAWERKPGSPLPTLEDTTNRHQKASINEGNSYYDLKSQYYEISDNMVQGGLLSTLQDIKKKQDTYKMDKIGGVDSEIKIWTAIHKLFNKSKLGKIL